MDVVVFAGEGTIAGWALEEPEMAVLASTVVQVRHLEAINDTCTRLLAMAKVKDLSWRLRSGKG